MDKQLDPPPIGAERDPLDARSRSLSPEDELELVDFRVRQAERDEHKTCFCPETAPKPPSATGPSEPVSDRSGGLIDVQFESPTVDELTNFDLSADDLTDVDL